MPFDSVVLAAVASEIASTAVGGQVIKLFQPSAVELLIHVRATSARWLLWVSIDPERFGVRFIEEPPRNPPAPPQFCMVARKHLEGARLLSVEQRGAERVLTLEFDRSDGRRRLLLELMGKHSNAVMVDDREIILDAMKHVGRRINRVRELLPGRPYVPPPPAYRPDAFTAGEAEVSAALKAAVGSSGSVTPQTLVKALSGAGPFFAREIVARAASTDPPVIASVLARLAREIRAGAFTPTLLTDDAGRPVDAWAFECRIVPPERQETAPTMSAALEVLDRTGAGAATLDRDRAELLARLAALSTRARRRRDDLMTAREAAGRSEEYRIHGELIQANLASIERGATEVHLANFYDPEGGTVCVTLDPRLSPQENVEAYFRRYRKARDGYPLLLERLNAAEHETVEWMTLAEEVAAAGPERLAEIASRVASELPERSGEESSQETKRPGPGVRRTVSSDGFEIWYGENRDGNDVLTTRLAAPTDLWLHVRAAASAHVVIRTAKRPETVPPRTLLEAARIAVAHSESKHAGMTPVDYTLKKYVRKPRGSGAGQALYTHEKTLFIDSQDDLIAG